MLHRVTMQHELPATEVILPTMLPGCMNQNLLAAKSAAGKSNNHMDVEIEFIGGEEAKRRWQELFKLLEAEAGGRERIKDSLNEADGPE